MLKPRTVRLIVWISCAHALVHVYEISLPAVEQAIARQYTPDDPLEGKRLTGMISTSWRLTWGFGALLAGWLVDRFGSRPMLAVYLIGCSLMCVLAAFASALWMLFGAMIIMGAMASIYHPAGLALISHATPVTDRPRALGLHGIFGSAGIGLTPLIAGYFFFAGGTWHEYYLLLSLPGLLLGGIFAWQAYAIGRSPDRATHSPGEPQRPTQWRRYLILVTIAAMQGFIYSAILSFLPRYLGQSAVDHPSRTADVWGNNLAGMVLLTGCLGQYLAGRLASPHRLEQTLAAITLANVLPLSWMALAQGWQRPLAAGLFALVHFMHQPVYNSLIAKYSSPARRSLCYGFSFAMGLGLGSLGAGFNGFSPSDFFTYSTLAALALAAGLGCLLLVLAARDGLP